MHAKRLECPKAGRSGIPIPNRRTVCSRISGGGYYSFSGGGTGDRSVILAEIGKFVGAKVATAVIFVAVIAGADPVNTLKHRNRGRERSTEYPYSERFPTKAETNPDIAP